MTIRLSNPSKKSPKKQQFDISPPQVSIDFSQVSTDSPHFSHPNLIIRLILDYLDDPEPYPTQFLQQNPLSQIVEEEGPSSVQFLVTCLQHFQMYFVCFPFIVIYFTQ